MADAVVCAMLSKRWLDAILLVLFAAGLALAAWGNEDPFARDAICKWTNICLNSDHAAAWHKLSYDIGLGTLISLIFYGLLVRYPERQKRRRIKRNLEQYYRTFKSDCVLNFLSVVNEALDVDQIDLLLDQNRFREYFKDKISPHQDRWGAFWDKLDEYHLKELLTSMEVLRDEIAFVLNNTDMSEDEPFEFFKRLSRAIYFIKNSTTLDYDATKPLARFLWELFAGWDWFKGYRKEDIVKQMIRRI